MDTCQVPAEPFNWPKSAVENVGEFALLIIDMQNDYCSLDYYMDKSGYDIAKLREPISAIQRVIAVARSRGIQVIFTRHSESLDPTETRNETSAYESFGWEIVKELTPESNDTVFNKTTISAFMSYSLNTFLKKKGIKNLIFCGNTIDVCVHSSLRTANDLGYQCLLLEDCCGAVNEGLHKWSVESIKVENGVFGAVSDSKRFVDAFS